jgi:hypothetical protein
LVFFLWVQESGVVEKVLVLQELLFGGAPQEIPFGQILAIQPKEMILHEIPLKRAHLVEQDLSVAGCGALSL